MLAEWLRSGDVALAFGEPRLLPLALGALLLIAVAVLGRRGRASLLAAESRPGLARVGAATVLRVLAYLAAVGAAAGATIVTHETHDRVGVVAAVDGSSSISEGEQKWMKAWLDDLAGTMRSDDELTVVKFGRGARLVAGPGAPGRVDLGSADVDPTATNLMAAIDSGASLNAVPGGAIVLLTDGNQTMGDAAVAADGARRRRLRIYPLVPPRRQAPLTIEHVAAPAVAREGHDVTLSVAIANRGTTTLEGTLVARQGENELGRLPLRVAPGRSVVDATVNAGAAGHYVVTVGLEAPPEVASPRARRATVLTVLPRARVLLVARSAAFAPLLREAGFAVDQVATLQETSEAGLARYHCVVLGDVARSDLAPGALAALERYVRERGGGLLVAAGRGVVSDPVLKGSALERILPVRVKEQTPPKPRREPLALFLVIDRSSSMSYGLNLSFQNPTRIAYAREAALALIAQLEDRDLVGAAAFDTQTSILAPLAPLAQNRDPLNDLISRLIPSGGTDFKEALEIAARQLIASGKHVKHVILLTDGASIRPASEHEGLINALAESGVSVTSIRIGDDPESFELVKNIAERTGGHFYHVTDSTSLPNLMIQDTAQRASRDKPESGEPEFRPRIGHAGQALGGLSNEDLPVLRSFAAVPLKEGADALLVTDQAAEHPPILAAWQIGLGRVVVFTADPSPEWQGWSQVRRFWSQLARWVARPESADELRLALRNESDRTTLSIETYDSALGGEVQAQFKRLDGIEQEIELTPVGLRRYEATLPPLATLERRFVVSKRVGRELIFRHEEWLPEATPETEVGGEDPEAEPNWPLLSQVAEITGGAVNPPLSAILARAPADRQVSSSLVPMLSVAALVLALADIALRLVGAPK
ncbi:MAG TPA: VWA domain-containing protein [Candidatus Bathyarchaeia archaeon]|nr:VWA domain-containing protein [Candidatus Bathyarchaeia archaeon]